MSMMTAACPHAGHAATPSCADAFRDFVAAGWFPCVGAKAALSRGTMDIVELGRLGDRSNDATLLDGIARFARHLEGRPGDDLTLHTHVAVFDGPRDTDEARFEALLWAQLQRLHDLDLARGSRWAGDVSSDPDDPRFSLSLGGHPFFVIGLHPGASRRARRFAWPAMVFNSHRQFDRLRPTAAMGGCRPRSASAMARCRGRSIRTWRILATPARRASTVDARWGRSGAARCG